MPLREAAILPSASYQLLAMRSLLSCLGTLPLWTVVRASLSKGLCLKKKREKKIRGKRRKRGGGEKKGKEEEGREKREGKGRGEREEEEGDRKSWPKATRECHILDTEVLSFFSRH